MGEKSRLDRVISNLLENALRLSPPNSTVTIELQQKETYILISVMDEGAGVPSEISNNLF